MVFRTKYEPVKVSTPAGSPEMVEYSARYDDDGVIILEEVGKRNIYDEIQSHAESVDLNNLIRRFENGEVDVLSRTQGVFEDITKMPRSYAEMLNLIRVAEDVFEQLPIDVREAYNHSFEQFFAQGGIDMLRPESDRPAEPEKESETE